METDLKGGRETGRVVVWRIEWGEEEPEYMMNMYETVKEQNLLIKKRTSET